MSNSILVIVKSKAKEEAMKWISIAYGKEGILKEKLEHLITFAPHDLTKKNRTHRRSRNFLGTIIASTRIHEHEYL